MSSSWGKWSWMKEVDFSTKRAPVLNRAWHVRQFLIAHVPVIGLYLASEYRYEISREGAADFVEKQEAKKLRKHGRGRSQVAEERQQFMNPDGFNEHKIASFTKQVIKRVTGVNEWEQQQMIYDEEQFGKSVDELTKNLPWSLFSPLWRFYTSLNTYSGEEDPFLKTVCDYLRFFGFGGSTIEFIKAEYAELVNFEESVTSGFENGLEYLQKNIPFVEETKQFVDELVAEANEFESDLRTEFEDIRLKFLGLRTEPSEGETKTVNEERGPER